MKMKQILTGTIVGGALFLSVTVPIFASDAPVTNLYNNPTLQSLMQQNTQSVQGYNNANNNNRNQLHNLLKIHTVVAGITFIARYENSQYLGQLQQQVQQNTDQLTNLIGKLYGQNKQNDFKTLWVDHINLLNQYTDARKTNNRYELQQTNQQLQLVADRLADFLGQNNQSQRNNLQQLLQTHMNEEKAIIDTHAAGRDDQLINLFLQAANHADMMADAILQASPHPSPTHIYYRVQ